MQNQNVDLCLKDPGREVNVYFTVELRIMVDYRIGDVSLKQASADGRLKLVGEHFLIRNVSSWLAPSVFAELPGQISPRNTLSVGGGEGPAFPDGH